MTVEETDAALDWLDTYQRQMDEAKADLDKH